MLEFPKPVVTILPKPVTILPKPLTILPKPVTILPKPVTILPKPVTILPARMQLAAPAPYTKLAAYMYQEAIQRVAFHESR
jgi:hypothetical protein